MSAALDRALAVGINAEGPFKLAGGKRELVGPKCSTRYLALTLHIQSHVTSAHQRHRPSHFESPWSRVLWEQHSAAQVGFHRRFRLRLAFPIRSRPPTTDLRCLHL